MDSHTLSEDSSPSHYTPNADDPGPVPPPSEVNEFLRKKRKAREHKACYPCRLRKVRCDLTRPCKTCRDRDHPEACSYHPPNKRPAAENPHDGLVPRSVAETKSSSAVTLSRSDFDVLCQKLSNLEESITDLRREVRSIQEANAAASLGTDQRQAREQPHDERTDARRQSHTDRHGLHTKNESGEIVHFGGDSIPALLFGLGQESPETNDVQQPILQEYLGKNVLPLFGLDNESATYPFVDLWGLPHGSIERAKKLANVLPLNSQMEKFYETYRDVSHIIYPGVADIERFGLEVTQFVADRDKRASKDEGIDETIIYGKSFHWLALLFAVMAAGAQSVENMGRRERQLTSSVYVCCSFECLRFTNFIAQPSVHHIQALSLIGFVLSNNMNAGIAWSLLGLTIRLAQGLGLHQVCPPRIPAEVVHFRSKIWWAIIWQDSLLSTSYDRIGMLDTSTRDMPQKFGAVGAYHGAMYRLSQIATTIIRNRAAPVEPRLQISRIHAHRDSIAQIIAEASPHLRDSRQCSSKREAIEHWGLYMHSSYVLSELFRPAIGRAASNAGTEIAQLFRQPCVESLIDTVDAYIGLNGVTFYAQQSWGAIHRGLSSALLLGILGEHRRRQRVMDMIARLVNLMNEIISSRDRNELSSPMERGIRALKRFLVEAESSSKLDSTHSSHSQMQAQAAGASSLFSPPETLRRSDSFSMSSPGTDSSPHSVLNMILWGEGDLS